MYKLNRVKSHKDYRRDFEGMGDNLLLLKIESKIKNSGFNYHLFYRNNIKPPLDIAVNPNDMQIEYISYFLQDELIEIRNQAPNVFIKEESLIFTFNNLSVDNLSLNYQDNLSLNYQDNFNAFLVNNGLFILKESFEKEIYAHKLSQDNYILIDKANNIIGVYFENLTLKEFKELKDTKVL